MRALRWLKRSVCLLCAVVVTAALFPACYFAKAEEPDVSPEPSATEAPTPPPPAYVSDVSNFSVDALREGRERISVSLGGTWEAAVKPSSFYGEYLGEPIEASEQVSFPGIIKAETCKDYVKSDDGYCFVLRSVVTAENLSADSLVFFEMPSIESEKSLFINGTMVKELGAGLVRERIDISDVLTEGANEIVVLINSEKATVELGEEASITVSGKVFIENVKTSCIVDEGILSVNVVLNNYSAEDIKDRVEVTVYELGTVVNGVSSVRNGVGFVSENVVLPAGETAEVSGVSVNLRDFSADKYWSPENPYLYEIEIRTSVDTYVMRTGVREFSVATEESSYPVLNGSPFFMSGITLDFDEFVGGDSELFYSVRNREWIKKFMSELKEKSLSVIKSERGLFPSLWYDVADEQGMLLISEVSLSVADDVGAEGYILQAKKIMDLLYNNPSVAVWDMSDAVADSELLRKIVDGLRDFDIQGRPFDCGFAIEPASEKDIIECDISELEIEDIVENGVYTEGSGGVIYYPEEHSWNVKEQKNPKIITNYGTEKQSTEELLLLTEYLRVQRKFAGILMSAELISTEAGTYVASNALDRVGLTVEYYSETSGRGDTVSFDVAVMNDTAENIDDLNVTVVLRNGEDEIFSKTTLYDSIKKYGSDGRDIARRKFDIEIPAYIPDNTVTVIEAHFSLNGKVIKSTRKITINGGVPYESPYSTLFVAGTVGACILIIASAAAIAFAQQKRNDLKNKNLKKTSAQ